MHVGECLYVFIFEKESVLDGRVFLYAVVFVFVCACVCACACVYVRVLFFMVPVGTLVRLSVCLSACMRVGVRVCAHVQVIVPLP